MVLSVEYKICSFWLTFVALVKKFNVLPVVIVHLGVEISYTEVVEVKAYILAVPLIEAAVDLPQ